MQSNVKSSNCLRNCIGGVMVSLLPSSVVDRGFGSNQTIKLIFVASPLSTQHFKEKVQRPVGSESG